MSTTMSAEPTVTTTAPAPRSSVSVPRVLRPELAGIRLSAKEFDAAEIAEPYRHYRFELIAGRLIVMTAPLPQERDANEELAYLLRDYQRRHANGRAIDRTLSEQELRIGEDRRRADRVIWTGLGRVPDPVADVPSIVVEFVSAGRRNAVRDYQEKRAEYLSIGVREYWIVDRFARTLTVVSGSSASPTERVIAAGQSYATPLLPGFELSPDRLFAQADDWDRPTGSAAAQAPAASASPSSPTSPAEGGRS